MSAYVSMAATTKPPPYGALDPSAQDQAALDHAQDHTAVGLGPSPDGPEDKRTEDRAAITLKVDYRRLNSFFADYTKNISKGGTFIRTSKPLEIGTEFVFVLSLPTLNEQLQLNGEVMWVVDDVDATEEQPPGMGIKFKFESDAERAKVDDFVERLMVDALGTQISQRLLARK
jgi:type IV pilus assembly protein PilZ